MYRKSCKSHVNLELEKCHKHVFDELMPGGIRMAL